MGVEVAQFGADPNPLIQAIGKIIQKYAEEGAARREKQAADRKADQEQRQQERAAEAARRANERAAKERAAAHRQRVRAQITAGQQQKQAVQSIGRAAESAMRRAIRSSTDYERSLHAQEQALRSGAITNDEFIKRKFELLRALRQAKRDQSGETAAIKEAERILKSARTATDEYARGVAALDVALRRGEITAEEYAQAERKLAEDKQKVQAAQSGETAAVREAQAILERSKTATDRYREAERALKQALDTGKISAEQYARGMRQIQTELRGARTAQTSWKASLVGTVGALTGFTGGVAAALKIIAQLRAEYQRLIETQRESAEVHVTLAAAQSKAVKNLGNDAEFDADKLFATIRKESQRLGIDEVQLTQAVSDALSARGDGTVRSAIDSVLAAAKFERFGGADTLRTLSGSASDIRKRTGLSDEASLGFLSQIGQLSRVTDTAQLSRNVAPAVVNALSSGASREFAGAMVAALSQGIVDETGRISRTGLTSVLTALERFDPNANIEQTFRRLQNDAGARQQFFAENTFEKKALFAVRDLFTQGTAVNRTFQSGFQNLRQNDPLLQYRRVVAQIEGLESVRVAKLQQFLKNTSEQSSLANVGGAVSGVVRDELARLRKALGRSGFGSKLDALFEDLKAGGELDLETLKPALQSEIRNIQFDTVYEYAQGPNDTVVPIAKEVPAELDTRDRKNILLLEDLIQKLDSLEVIETPAPVRVNPEQEAAEDRQRRLRAAQERQRQQQEFLAQQRRDQIRRRNQAAEQERLQARQQQLSDERKQLAGENRSARAERTFDLALRQFGKQGDEVRRDAQRRVDGGQARIDALIASITENLDNRSLSREQQNQLRLKVTELQKLRLAQGDQGGFSPPVAPRRAQPDLRPEPAAVENPGGGVKLISRDPMQTLVKHAETMIQQGQTVIRILQERLPDSNRQPAPVDAARQNSERVQKQAVAAQRESVGRMRNRNGGVRRR